MPAGVKPIQCVGVKGKSGRKKKYEELQIALADAKETITQEALIELANSKVFTLLKECTTIEEVKALGLPITLKGITEKKEIKWNITMTELLNSLND